MKPFQELAFRWAKRCFSSTAVHNIPERAARFLEEAAELCQALSLTEQEAQSVITYVYNRPVGETYQEAGGVMMTFAVLCERLGISMENAGFTELMRCCENIEKIRLKHLKKPKFGVLPK